MPNKVIHPSGLGSTAALKQQGREGIVLLLYKKVT